MGGIIKVECTCGFETDYMGGSGKENFEEVCYAPALCQNCRELIIGNYMDATLTCEKCSGKIIYYNAPELHEGTKRGSDADSKKRPALFILPSEKCECPRCGQKNLSFTHVGCWQ